MDTALTGKRSKDQAIKDQLTEKRLKDPVTKETVRIIADILIALSGLILLSDKVLPQLNLENNFGFKDTKTLVWVFSQSISPIILILGVQLKPHKISYSIPVYLYFIQLYWVFDPSLKFDDWLLHIYATGAAIGFVLLVWAINIFIHKAHRAKTKNLQVMQSLLDLYFKANGR